MSKRRRSRRRAPQLARRQTRRQTTTPNDTRQQGVSPATSHWALSVVADAHTVRLATECIGDIAASVAQVNDQAMKRQLTRAIFQRECRNISTRVRKLVLPSGEELLERCFVPMMHPFTTPEESNTPETLTHWIGDVDIEYTEGGCSETKRVSVPSEHEHETAIGPLYGLKRTRDRTYQFEEPFDWSATPLRLRQWLNLKVLQVDDDTISAEEMLRMMANREGAHSELNEMATHNPELPVNLTMGDPEDEPYRRANIINFSGISYVQIFTFLVGCYLAKMMKATLNRIRDELTTFGSSNEEWWDILQTPAELPPLALVVDRFYSMGVVLQNTGEGQQPIRMIGDYKTPGRTVVRIP